MIKNKRKLMLYILDSLAICTSITLALILKFGVNIPSSYFILFEKMIFGIILLKLFTYNKFDLYNTLWEYASIEELIQIVQSTVLANAIGIIYLYVKHIHISLSVLVLVLGIDIALIGGIRFSYRIFRRLKNNRSITIQGAEKSILVVGAGATADMITVQIKNNPSIYGKLIGYIDDDEKLYNTVIKGTKVLGNRYDIYSIVKRYNINEIILAIPTVSPKDKALILEECSKTNCKVKTVPGIQEIVDGQVSMSEVRDVEIEDLLGRDPINLNSFEISKELKDKVVLVTGGGGSIGSELCRQIANFHPKKLIIVDIYENNAYDIQMELNKKYNEKLDLSVIIASVRDKKNINRIFREFSPQIVFHAAAHKHVPLMETSPQEAIKNNSFGTRNVAEAADKYNVEKFILISTDKAVNPTNVMGASKKMCEMIAQSLNEKSKTKFVGVRFGNVLGSNGSVIPLFKKQILCGGPVTVTHKDIIRYFMTIPEASQLVLQSAAYAHGGEIFVLDMGEPVRILDLAENLVKLSGFKPYEEIEIEFTGLRPGEKLYEELLVDEEMITNETDNEKIFIGKSDTIDYSILTKRLDQLQKIIDKEDNVLLKEKIKELVPTYKNNEEVNNVFKPVLSKEITM